MIDLLVVHRVYNIIIHMVILSLIVVFIARLDEEIFLLFLSIPSIMTFPTFAYLQQERETETNV